MERTQRHSTLAGSVRTAMRRRDEHRTASLGNPDAASRRHQIESEPMIRWENEGGALGHSVDRGPRPLP